MNAAIIIGLAAFGVGLVCLFASFQCLALMADAVNRERKGEEPLVVAGWQWDFSFERERKIIHAYRAVYPNERIPRYFIALIVVHYACGLVFVGCFVLHFFHMPF